MMICCTVGQLQIAITENGSPRRKAGPSPARRGIKQNELECEPVSILQRKNTGLAGIGSN